MAAPLPAGVGGARPPSPPWALAATGPPRPPRRPDRDAGSEAKQGVRPRFEGRSNGPPGGARDANGGKPAPDNRGSKPPGGKPGGGKRFDKPRDDWREHRPREERKPAAIDPNSPWAALAALRNPKAE